MKFQASGLVPFMGIRGKAELNIFDLDGNKIGSNLAAVEEVGDFSTVYRLGSDLYASHQGHFAGCLIAGSSGPTISMFSDGGSTIIQAGAWIDNIPFIGVGAGPAVATLVTFIVANAVAQAVSNHNGEGSYFYYGMDGDTFKVDPKSTNLRQRLDEYEISSAGLIRKNRRFYHTKEYCAFGEGILAVYKFKDEKTIQLVYFE